MRGVLRRKMVILEKWRDELEAMIDHTFASLREECYAGRERAERLARLRIIKTPELLKMIEMHAKSASEDTEVQKFWAFIENVRRRKHAQREAASHPGNQPTDRSEETKDEPTGADPAASDR